MREAARRPAAVSGEGAGEAEARGRAGGVSMTTGRDHKSGEPGTGGRRLRRGLEAAAGSVTLVLAYRGAASVVLALGPLALGRRNAAAAVCTAALVALEASACDEARWPGLVARTGRPPLAGSAIGVSTATMPSSGRHAEAWC